MPPGTRDMKIHIESGKTKRTLDGPFNICGHRDDLWELMEQLRTKLEDQTWSYGWIYVRGSKQASIPGPPISWEGNDLP